MYIETWYKIFCDKCKTANWFCDGDTSDCTGVNIEACQCFKCDHCWPIDDTFLDDLTHEDEQESLESKADKGLEKPT